MLSRLIAPLGLLLTLHAFPAAAQDRPYSEGSVWNITMIRTTEGMQRDYLESLVTTWKRIHDEAKKQGMIVSYRVLRSTAYGPGDWDLLLIVEYKNWAALDGSTAKFDAIQQSFMGREQSRQLAANRVSIRTILGEKNAQELIFK